jgi:hypothetical protein
LTDILLSYLTLFALRFDGEPIAGEVGSTLDGGDSFVVEA